MARTVDHRLIVTGMLVAQTPLHVGGHGEDPDTDMPLAVDGAGRFYIPGTSLAGPMRHWCQLAFANHYNTFWGYQDQGVNQAGHASFATVKDAVVPAEFTPELRDHVGIDRDFSAAAEHIKFDRAILPRGVKLPLKIIVDVPEKHANTFHNIVTALTQALEQGEVRLGAAKTRGLGKVKLQELTITRQERAGRLILDTITGGGTDFKPASEGVCSKSKAQFPSSLKLTIQWHPVGPLMVRHSLEGATIDSLPLLSAVPGGLALCLPGSSVKGALRTHAEKIVRTILNLDPPKDPNPRKRFIEYKNVNLVRELFGAPMSSDKISTLGLGALGVDDCYGDCVSTDQWEAILAADDEPAVRTALRSSDKPHWQQAFHSAVDRWTGGAADQFLFNVLEPRGAAWQNLELTLDPNRLGMESNAAFVLLLLVLRDLCRGVIPLGFATHRGMGHIAVDSITVEGRGEFLPSKQVFGNEECMSLPTAWLNVFDPTLAESIKAAWKNWTKCDDSEAKVNA